MKTIWVIVIAILCLAVGFFVGGVGGGLAGGLGGAVVGAEFGSCSVLEDAVQRGALNEGTAQELYDRFRSRAENTAKSANVATEAPLFKDDYQACKSKLDEFRSSLAKNAAK